MLERRHDIEHKCIVTTAKIDDLSLDSIARIISLLQEPVLHGLNASNPGPVASVEDDVSLLFFLDEALDVGVTEVAQSDGSTAIR